MGIKPTILLILLLFAVFFQIPDFLYADIIYFKDGKVVESETVWEEGDKVKYQKYGAVIEIDKTSVLKIEVNDSEGSEPKDGEKNKYCEYVKTHRNKAARANGRIPKVRQTFTRNTWYSYKFNICDCRSIKLKFEIADQKHGDREFINVSILNNFSLEKPSRWGREVHSFKLNSKPYIIDTKKFGSPKWNCDMVIGNDGSSQGILCPFFSIHFDGGHRLTVLEIE